MQDVEFTIEDGKLWILQTRSAKRTPRAALRIAIDLVRLDGATRLDWLVSLAPTGLLRPMGPLLAATFRRAFAKDLGNLKAMMETGEL